ncbi:MAG: hypothetical protein ACP5IE_03450 [Infirmifilum sp.]
MTSHLPILTYSAVAIFISNAILYIVLKTHSNNLSTFPELCNMCSQYPLLYAFTIAEITIGVGNVGKSMGLGNALTTPSIRLIASPSFNKQAMKKPAIDVTKIGRGTPATP